MTAILRLPSEPEPPSWGDAVWWFMIAFVGGMIFEGLILWSRLQ